MTIKEIAKQANVSIGTVDRVLHNRGRVSNKTRETIKKIIKQSDYKPNIFAHHLKTAKNFTFAVLMPEASQESNFWEATTKGIDKAQNELRLYKIKIKYFYYDRFSEESFKTVSERMLKSEINGILLAPVIYDLCREFIKKIPENIPFVFFNANIPDSKAISFIGQDPYQSGVVAAKLMSIMLKEKGEIAVIQGGSKSEYHHIERVRGFETFFKDNKDYSIMVYNLVGHPDKKWFYEVMDKIYFENKNLTGIFATSALTHYAAEYIKTKYTGKKIYLIGYDLVAENTALLNEGIIDFLINQKIEEQGFRGIYALYKNLILHEKTEKEFLMPIDIITRENLNYYK